MPKIKIFLDGADRATMLEMNRNPLVSGFTTNPSLMRKAGVKDYRSYARELLGEIREKPVSFEVFADDPGEIRRQALEIASWGKNVYVKIPVLNTEGQTACALVRDLSHDGVRVNVTAVFTLEQAWGASQALKGGAPSLVSVFAGRLADVGLDPVPVMAACAAVCAGAGPEIELLWASTREAYNVVQAEQAGCQVITAPSDVIRKVAGFGRKPFDLSLETVRTFKSDSAGFSL